MGIFSGCILACDVDGTLIANGYINPKNIEKIEYFINEGGYFSLSTGRTVRAVDHILDGVKRISPSVVDNGCIIYDYENERILDEVCLAKSDYIIAKKVIDMGLNVGVEVHAETDVITLYTTTETDDHQKYELLTDKKLSFEDACDYEWNKVIFLFDNRDDFEKVKAMISKETTSSSSFVETTATLYGRKRCYYEQIPTGISKATTLDKLCDMLNVKDGCKFAIGDYYNDLEMLKKADLSAVPTDAPEDIKACADFIAGTCKDGAVADFIDYLSKLRKD